jgi:hypothetical protein
LWLEVEGNCGNALSANNAQNPRASIFLLKIADNRFIFFNANQLQILFKL